MVKAPLVAARAVTNQQKRSKRPPKVLSVELAFLSSVVINLSCFFQTTTSQM
jgi:hypothetical protein